MAALITSHRSFTGAIRYNNIISTSSAIYRPTSILSPRVFKNSPTARRVVKSMAIKESSPNGKPHVLMMQVDMPYLRDSLESKFNLLVLSEHTNRDEYLAMAGGSVRAVVTSTNSVVGAKLLEKLPNVEIVASFSVGLDKVSTTIHYFEVPSVRDVAKWIKQTLNTFYVDSILMCSDTQCTRLGSLFSFLYFLP